MYWPIDEKVVNMVETEEELSNMFEHLKKATEIAIDLEVSNHNYCEFSSEHGKYMSNVFNVTFQHHSYRSFQGFVCLMQISTRKEDFIVDTLKLREQLYILNEIFTDTKVLKVTVKFYLRINQKHQCVHFTYANSNYV